MQKLGRKKGSKADNWFSTRWPTKGGFSAVPQDLRTGGNELTLKWGGKDQRKKRG